MVDQKHIHLSAVSKDWKLNFKEPILPEEVVRSVDRLFKDITSALEQEGCRFIGHIKALLDAGDVGQIFFSVTRFDQTPRRKGRLEGGLTVGSLTINVIVPDVSQDMVEKIAIEAFKRRFDIDMQA